MIQVRKNVFETNSSSTHSLVMAVASDFDKWLKGEAYYCTWTRKEAGCEAGKFYTKDEVIAFCEKLGVTFQEDEEPWEGRREYFETYNEFCDSDYLEVSDYSYTTPSGEVIKAVAKYGYDG